MGHRPITHMCAPSVVAVAAVALAASNASAHVGASTHGLFDGALHPLTGIDHLLAMLAVGVVATFTGRVVAVPGAFLFAMAVGGVLGVAGIGVPGTEVAIVVSVIVLGLATIAAPSTAAPWLVAAVAVAGFAHGHAHGTEVPSAASPLLYAIGFLAVTAVLHVVGVAVGVALRRTASLRIAVGATVVVTGVLLLG